MTDTLEQLPLDTYPVSLRTFVDTQKHATKLGEPLEEGHYYLLFRKHTPTPIETFYTCTLLDHSRSKDSLYLSTDVGKYYCRRVV